MRHHRRSHSGFTLIELLVTLVVIGLVMGLAINQAGKMFSRELKASARQLSSTIRFLYNKAASEGVTLRLVIDFDENSYSAEATSDSFTLKKETEEDLAKKKEEESSTEGEEEGVVQPKEAEFSPEGSKLLKSTKLSKRVFFKDVYAEHQIDALSEGKAYIYFFRHGLAEQAVINLRDKDDEKHFSLTINPINGNVKIANEYQSLEVEK